MESSIGQFSPELRDMNFILLALSCFRTGPPSRLIITPVSFLMESMLASRNFVKYDEMDAALFSDNA